MTRLSIIVPVLVIGIVVRCASALDTPRLPEDGRRTSPQRTLKPVPLSDAEKLQFARVSRTRAGGATGEVVYQFLELGGFLPQLDPWGLDEILPAEDMILAPGSARELFSYMVRVHQRAVEGPMAFTAHLSLYTDDGNGAESLPDALIEGASCSISGLHGLGRPDEGFAVCLPNPSGDTGIILGNKVWVAMWHEGGCLGANQQHPDCTEPPEGEWGFLGPGWLLGPDYGVPSVGSTEPTFAMGSGRNEVHLWGLIQFIGNLGLVCSASAGIPAPVPTVSDWGMVLIVLLVLTGGTIVLRRSRHAIMAR